MSYNVCIMCIYNVDNNTAIKNLFIWTIIISPSQKYKMRRNSEFNQSKPCKKISINPFFY